MTARSCIPAEGRLPRSLWGAFFRAVVVMTLSSGLLLPMHVRAATTDPVGTTYPPQKIVFQDPLTSRTVWRLTVDGTQQGALNTLRDASGMEANQFAPDNKRICFSKKNHGNKPAGYYVMDILTGVETYVGPGTNSWAMCAFSKNSNELFFAYFNSGTSSTTRWMEVRAVNLTTFSTRVLRRFAGAFGGPYLSVNADGTYLAVGFRVPNGDPADFVDDPVYHIILKTSDGSEHPNWTYDVATPDEYNAGGFPYWHSTDPRVVRLYRDQVLAIWNVDTLAKLPSPVFAGAATTLMGAHSCWTVDNAIHYYSKGSAHPDCHPLDAGKGENTRVVLDRATDGYPYLYVTAMKNAASPGVYPAGTTDVVALHYTYNKAINGDVRYGHPHPHFSRDGKYILWATPVTNLSQGSPPGGVNTVSPYKSDLFVVVLDEPGAPSITATAAASPSPVTGSTTALSVMATDDAGEAALTYTWAATGPAAVKYSRNGTNAAKSTIATFSRAGSYTFTVSVENALGLTATSSVAVDVLQSLAAMAVTPATASVPPEQSLAFLGSGSDQFGDAMPVTPSWTVSGGGTISNAGLFTAGSTAGGPFVITAASGAVTATASITVTSVPPVLVVQLVKPAAGAVVWGTVELAAQTSDDGRVSVMRFLVDGMEAGSDTSSPFVVTWDSALSTQGPHTLRAEATEATGTVLSPEISITVAQPSPDLPPTVSFDGPTGEVGPDVVLRASAADDQGIAEVVFELDGVEVARVAAAPWQAGLTGLSPGAHRAKAVALDTTGQRAEDSGAFTVRTVPGEILGNSCGCTSGEGSLAGWFGLALLSALRRRRS